jgi:hypothetical protein
MPCWGDVHYEPKKTIVPIKRKNIIICVATFQVDESEIEVMYVEYIIDEGN